MIGKEFIITQTRCLLNEFIAPIADKTDKPRQKFCFIRLMRRWPAQIGASGLIREKNRLGRGSNLGSQGGNIPIIRKSQNFNARLSKTMDSHEWRSVKQHV